MSRSIHTTRSTLRRLSAEFQATKSDATKAAYKAALETKWRKRVLKTSVCAERHRPEAAAVPTPLETIKVRIRDESDRVLHGATKNDILAVISALPQSAREGLAEIHLELGVAYQVDVVQARAKDPEDEPLCDPLVGRPGALVIPGVYSGLVLGTYFKGSGLIRVYAFVLDRTESILPEVACRIYLRLHALKTLVHEIAHHQDVSVRIKRGRWLADRKENVENYAERMEYEWAREIVVPYLERTYPAEVTALLDWVERHGGVRLKLEFFAGDPRVTRRDGLLSIPQSGAEAFETWMKKFPKEAPLVETRLAFAWRLHYGDYYDECLIALTKILAESPAHPGGRALKADTLAHLDRLDEATKIVVALLAEHPELQHAWEIQANIFEDQENWRELIACCDRWLQVATEKKDRFHALLQRAVARCALGDGDIEAILSEFASAIKLQKPDIYRNIILRRAGKPTQPTPKPNSSLRGRCV